MADTSRDTFDPLKNYVELVYQQGRPVLDAELNEMQKILRRQSTLAIQSGIGNLPFGTGLKLVPTIPVSDRVNVNPGVFFNYGRVIEVHTPLEVPRTGTGASLVVEDVYLVWTEKEIDRLSDPNATDPATAIVDPAVGIETARRTQLDVSVSVSPKGTPLTLAAGEEAIFLGRITQQIGATTFNTDVIEDLRVNSNANYVITGLEASTSGGTITFTDGQVISQSVVVDYTSSVVALAASETAYLYWDPVALDIVKLTVRQAPPFMLLYTVTTDGAATVTDIVDHRPLFPSAVDRVREFTSDLRSKERQLYVGVTPSSPHATTLDTSTDELVYKAVIYSDPVEVLGIQDLGLYCRVQNDQLGEGNLNLYIDGNLVETISVGAMVNPFPADIVQIDFSIDPPFTSALTPWDPTGGFHDIELYLSNDTTLPGNLQLEKVDLYTRYTSPNRRVLAKSFQSYTFIPNTLFGAGMLDETTHTGLPTTPENFYTFKFLHDPGNALDVQRIIWTLSYKTDGALVGTVGSATIYVDGTVYDTVLLEDTAGSYEDFNSSFDLGLTVGFHTIDLEIVSVDNSESITTRAFEVYFDQKS